MPVNYKNGKIYCIRSPNTDMIYIGATAQVRLCNRMKSHRKSSNRTTSRKIIQAGDAYIELIENFPCNSKEELNAREAYFIRRPEYNKFCINIVYKLFCPHDRKYHLCVLCHGPGICSHNKRRYRCKDCNGKGICLHNRLRSRCKLCYGSEICKHKKQRNICKLCNGSRICEHNCRRNICKLCKGKYLCVHNRQRNQCIPCDGISMCVHNRNKHRCAPCHGSGICPHKKIRGRCIECSPIKCEPCDRIYCKDEIKRHQKSKKHISNAKKVY